MQSLESEDISFKLDTIFDREPMEFFPIGGDMRPTRGTSYNATEGVLDGLETSYLLFSEAIEERIAVIDPASDHGVGKERRDRPSEVTPDSVEIFNLGETGSADSRYVFPKREIGIKSDTKIPNVIAGRQRGTEDINRKEVGKLALVAWTADE